MRIECPPLSKMAKAPNSVIGIDLGRYALKSVLLQRRGPDKFAVTHYATHALTGPVQNAEALGKELKALLSKMGGSAKSCGIGISSPEALIRIIEQPPTPPDILRDALRLNGMALLNQDCRAFVLDCDLIAANYPAPVAGEAQKKKYLVGGIPRTEVSRVAAACDMNGTRIGRLQLAPLCSFNAFEFAHPEIFNEHAFFLVDIGHSSSTVMVGSKRELVLVRSIDCGGRALMDALMSLSGESREGVLQALMNEDEVMVESARMALVVLTREIGNSIGFFEARSDETIDRIYVSGAAARSTTLLKVMSEEVRMPCEAWSALAKCEILLNSEKAALFTSEASDLNVACGAATEILQGK